MGNSCSFCARKPATTESTLTQKLSPEEIERRREIQAKAAEDRAKDFKQGGGGEKLKAKSLKLEQAEKKNREGGADSITPAMWN